MQEKAFITLGAFPELKDLLPYANALSEAGIEHRITEQFKVFDPTFADNRKMDQVRLEVLEEEHDAAVAVISGIDQVPLRVIKNTVRAKRGSVFWILTTVILLLTTLWFAKSASNEENVEAQYDPLFNFKGSNQGIEQTWKDSGERAVMRYDEDRNGIFERIEYFDRAGSLSEQWLDADQDGLFEVRHFIAPNGEIEQVMMDADRDGRWE